MHISFHFSVLFSRKQRQSGFEVRPFRLSEKFSSDDLVRPGPRADLNPRLRNGVRELATLPGRLLNTLFGTCIFSCLNIMRFNGNLWLPVSYIVTSEVQFENKVSPFARSRHVYMLSLGRWNYLVFNLQVRHVLRSRLLLRFLPFQAWKFDNNHGPAHRK